MAQNMKKKRGQRGRKLLVSHPLKSIFFSPVSLLLPKFKSYITTYLSGYNHFQICHLLTSSSALFILTLAHFML